jgi:tyrosine-protein kinase Etk/Wzc
LLSLMNQLFEAEFETEKLRKLSGDKNPQLQVLEESILKLKPSITASINNLRISLQSTKEKLNNEAGEITAKLKGIPQKERSLLEISRQQQIKNSIYTFLLQKREEAILSAAAQVPNHRVINFPEYTGQVSPRSDMAYAAAFSLAVALVFVFIYLKEFSRSKILFSGDLVQDTGLPLLGELAFSDRSGENVIIDPSERVLIAEQLRDLRTNLSYIQNPGTGASVLLITSSMSGEGKSFLAANLGASISRIDKRVLLMECDLRKPALCKKLGVNTGKGLTEYLIGAANLEDILRPVEQHNNLFLISSGAIPPNPVELLLNGKFHPLMEKLKGEFDYIIIDAPPVAMVTDAKVLAMEANCTLYVVRYNYTPISYLAFIKEQAIRKTLPAINLVLNGIVLKKIPGYRYGYGYGYGNSYSYGYGYGHTIEDKSPMPRLKKMLKWLKFGKSKD